MGSQEFPGQACRANTKMANLSLLFMGSKCSSTGTEIVFIHSCLQLFGLHINACGRNCLSMKNGLVENAFCIARKPQSITRLIKVVLRFFTAQCCDQFFFHWGPTFHTFHLKPFVGNYMKTCGPTGAKFYFWRTVTKVLQKLVSFLLNLVGTLPS